jgi:hypothetical protein
LHPIINDYSIGHDSSGHGGYRAGKMPFVMPPVVRNNMDKYMDTMASSNLNTLMRYPPAHSNGSMFNQIPKITSKNNTINT